SKGGTTELFNPVTIFSNSASNTPLKVKGYASQTANLQEWQSSAGYALAYINKDGNITTAGSVSTNYLTTGYYATIGGLYNSVALTVKGTSGQTNNLQEWQDSTGAVLASISPALNSTVTLKFSNDYSFRINWGNEPILSTESGKLVISSWAADRAALIVKGRTSQSANLQEWQDSSANTLVRVRPAGQLGVGINLITGTNFYVDQTIGTTNINMVIRGGASQTGDLTQWRNSADSTLAKIDSSGNLFAPTLQSTTASTATLTTNGDTGGLLIGTVATGNKGLVINAVASQTANLQEWQVNSSTYLFINNNGALRAGASIAGTGWAINNSIYGASVIPFLIRGAASQTADLQQWQNSSSTVLGKIDAYGTFTFNTGGHAIAGGNAAQIALRIYGASSQTADLQQWINSSNTVMAKVDANGNFSAISKSFDIEHPTKENMRLRYASLEGPENGVYVRGTAVTNIIELPDYWTGLVHEDSITVSLTSVGSAQNIYVEKIENNKVYIGGDLEKAFFTVYGERKDIDKITVEY
ncbi:hypothetical protein EB001_20230, partial [bacterium]|nr:hypothetical protein [bacterium]